MKILAGIAAVFFVLSCQPADITGALILIDNHAVWKYEDSGDNLFGDMRSDFRSKNFDDSKWKSGPSPFGYPETEQGAGQFGPVGGGTQVRVNASSFPHTTYYFRTTFTVKNIAGIRKLAAATAAADGYVMYLNGHVINRVNMPIKTAGEIATITAATSATEAADDLIYTEWDATAFKPYLVRGRNTIAVDVHSHTGTSGGTYFGMTLTADYSKSIIEPEGRVPKQVNLHIGDDAAAAVNVTYTTLEGDASKIVLTKKGTAGFKIIWGEGSLGGGNKYFHKIPVSGLEADTVYTYTAGSTSTFTGEFKTGPARGSRAPIKFIYLADPQVFDAADAKALGAVFAEAANMKPGFVYLAGDITNRSTSEEQWQWLFENGGIYGTGGQEMFGNYPVAVVEGNHDNSAFSRHINVPAQAGDAVYSFDYGPITFIMLNLETAGDDAAVRANQEAFLRAKASEAKARGQWVAAGFHKSLYTGAVHIANSDVVEARTFWGPILAELDIDLALQGHDHVYSRGFVKADGSRAFAGRVAENAVTADPANAPLYMVGGHAGGLKWYPMVPYTVDSGDPLMADYAFLDVNSARSGDGIPGNAYTSDAAQEQAIVELEVSPSKIIINCWMFKYDPETDTVTPKYLYDKLTITR